MINNLKYGTDIRFEYNLYREPYSLFLILFYVQLGFADKSGAFDLAQQVIKKVDGAKDILVDSNWSRSGLLSHIQRSNGHCLMAYEEMDTFFAYVVR